MPASDGAVELSSPPIDQALALCSADEGEGILTVHVFEQDRGDLVAIDVLAMK